MIIFVSKITRQDGKVLQLIPDESQKVFSEP